MDRPYFFRFRFARSRYVRVVCVRVAFPSAACRLGLSLNARGTRGAWESLPHACLRRPHCLPSCHRLYACIQSPAIFAYLPACRRLPATCVKACFCACFCACPPACAFTFVPAFVLACVSSPRCLISSCGVLVRLPACLPWPACLPSLACLPVGAPRGCARFRREDASQLRSLRPLPPAR